MMFRANHACFLFAVLTSACAMPTGLEHALRCDEDLTCGSGFACYRGFCIEQGSADGDAWDRDASPETSASADAGRDDAGQVNDPRERDDMDVDASSGDAPNAKDAGSDPSRDAQVMEDPNQPDAAARDSGTENPSPCTPEKCCKDGKNSCLDKCDDKSDQQECAECGRQCESGNCDSETCRGES